MRYTTFSAFLLLSLVHACKSMRDLVWDHGFVQNRFGRDVSCREGFEYAHESICCLNCPAGTHVKKPCLTTSGIGECQPCELDTYTEHSNGLLRCISCVKCRSDQETTEKCTRLQNTKCKCKKGSFCLPDQACEICKKCSRCKEDEEVVSGCTETSNTVCRKKTSWGSSISVTLYVLVPLITVVVSVAFIVYCVKTKCCKKAVASRCPLEIVKTCMGDGEDEGEDQQNAHNSKIEDSDNLQPFLEQNCVVGLHVPGSIETERDRGLGDSLTNTASSSQSSLALCTLPSATQPCHTNQSSTSSALASESRRLVPLNGEESLKKSFDFFEEIDVHYHNRFFRFIGLSDNAIKSTEALFPEDKVYELLKNWMEKEGLKADFNILIEALHYLDQRMSAENIISKAIINGCFKYEDE